MANEIVDSLLKKRGKGVLCKLDIEKTYDNWNFLIQIMKRMGFGEKCLDWIYCVS